MKWEYADKTYFRKVEEPLYPSEDLLEKGRDGWELVSMSEVYYPESRNIRSTFWFKRPLAE